MKWRNLKDVVPELKKRPGMFIGSNSIFDLATFLQGYDFALSVHGITKESLFDEDISFHDWIALRTHYYESTSGWANMLTETYGENRALEQFWGHYDEYLNRKYRVILCAFPEQNKPWRYQYDDVNLGAKYCCLRPHQVQILKYTDDPGFFIHFLDYKGNQIDSKLYCLNDKSLRTSLIGLNINDTDWQKYG